jgi:pyruvate kinase
MSERRAKIVSTIGPATQSVEMLKGLIEAGMDVARLNFSHGDYATHAQVIADLRALGEQLGKPVAILQDLQGPKIRIGALTGGQVRLSQGTLFSITTETIIGDARRASTTYSALPDDVKPGDHILVRDGLLRLKVMDVRPTLVECEVLDGGLLTQRAGMNLPEVEVSAPSLTAKDREDLRFGIDQQVDFVALSFVRRAQDIAELKELLGPSGARIATVAKLEKPQAIEALDGIMELADVVMVARGDLGVEISPERVPFVQKHIIAAARRHKIPVITATQMLESMVEHPRPTRAEASDVANAIIDGTDAVMLSAETAMGAYPLEAVRMMDRIARETERHPDELAGRLHSGMNTAPDEALDFPDAVAASACRIAVDIGAKAVIAFTQSGFTACLISKYRPPVPIIAVTPHQHVYRRLAMYRGVIPRQASFIAETDAMIDKVDADLRRDGIIQAGEPLVILAGTPSTQRNTTNLIKLHRAGEPLSVTSL